MNNLTLGEISTTILFITALLGGIVYIKTFTDKLIKKLFETEFRPINDKLDDLSDQVKRVDVNSTKNFLVRCLSDIENGQIVSETELERFWEQYEHYTKAGGNSYIHRKVEQLKAEGKL